MNRLDELRYKKGVTWSKLSDELSIPRTTLLEWSAGRDVTALVRIIAIADYFGVTVDYLLGRSDTLKIEMEDCGAKSIALPKYRSGTKHAIVKQRKGNFVLGGYDTDSDLKHAKRDVERMLYVLSDMSVYEILRELAPYRAKGAKYWEDEFNELTEKENKDE